MRYATRAHFDNLMADHKDFGDLGDPDYFWSCVLRSGFAVSVLDSMGDSILIWGVVQEVLLDNRVEVYIVVSNRIDSYKVKFLRESKKFIKKLAERYDLYARVTERSKDWIEWIGFKPFDATWHRWEAQ